MPKELKSLQDWNAALVDAVFLDPERAGTSLSRIDATGRLLAKVAGGLDEEQARRSFIKAFGSDAASIRSHFVWSPAITANTKRTGIPPIFAPLYLSLLAASADDATYNEGNFRNRFAALLHPVQFTTFSFTDLPRLWTFVANWSRMRLERTGDCAKLLLPDPQRESIIGHSKRLAFPTFKDERLLRRILRDAALDSQSDFESVSRTVHSSASGFSATFKDELASFTGFVASADFQSAFDSPFWGAVRDITWEEEQATNRKRGRFCIQFDASDPLDLELFLLTDTAGLAPLPTSERVELDPPRAGYSSLWASPNGGTSASALIELAGRLQGFRLSRVGRALLSGWIVCFPDLFGNLTTDGEFYADGPVCILVRDDQACKLIRWAKHLGLSCNEISSADGLEGWRGIMLDSVSRASLERLADSLPEGAKLSIRKGWRPATPHLSGGAWFGQALLLNPASTPVARLEGATSGKYVIYGDDRRQIAAGSLAEGDRGFAIPPKDLIGVTSGVLCSFELEIATQARRLDVGLITQFPARSFQHQKEPEDWLADASSGVLQSLGSLALGASKHARTEPIAANQPLFGTSALFELSANRLETECLPRSPTDIKQPFRWLCDALVLRFQRRASLPFDDLNRHLECAGDASGHARWKLSSLLFASCWLQVLQRRSAPYPVVAPARRTISFVDDSHRTARIVGMLSLHELHLLQGVLLAGESAVRIEARDEGLSIGCIELGLTNESRLGEIATALGVIRLNRSDLGSPFAGLFKPTSKVDGTRVPAAAETIELWDSRMRGWMAESPFSPELPRGAIFRTRGRNKTTYWVKSRNNYWTTDSFSWARFIERLERGSILGTLSQSGDVSWSGSLMGLPEPLCRWWLHWGGGCVAIDGNGCLVFMGGSAIELWGKVGVIRHGPEPSARLDVATSRRALALRLNKGRRERGSLSRTIGGR